MYSSDHTHTYSGLTTPPTMVLLAVTVLQSCQKNWKTANKRSYTLEDCSNTTQLA